MHLNVRNDGLNSLGLAYQQLVHPGSQPAWIFRRYRTSRTPREIVGSHASVGSWLSANHFDSAGAEQPKWLHTKPDLSPSDRKCIGAHDAF
jgi:hypothetical protein